MTPTLGQTMPPGCPIGQVRVRSIRTSLLYGELGYGGQLFSLAVRSGDGSWLPVASPATPNMGIVDWGSMQVVGVGYEDQTTIAVHQAGQYSFVADPFADAWMPRNPTLIELGNVTSNPWTVESWAADAHQAVSPNYLRYRSTLHISDDELRWEVTVSRTMARPTLVFNRWNTPWTTVDGRTVSYIVVNGKTYHTGTLPPGSAALSIRTNATSMRLGLVNGRQMDICWDRADVVKLWRNSEAVIPITAVLENTPVVFGTTHTLRFGLRVS